MSATTRPHIDQRTAAGMLKGIQSQHTCGEACTGTVRLGDGHVVTLACPYSRLDPAVEGDRRIIAAVYADMARAAMRSGAQE